MENSNPKGRTLLGIGLCIQSLGKIKDSKVCLVGNRNEEENNQLIV